MFTNVVLLTAFAFHFSVFSGRTLIQGYIFFFQVKSIDKPNVYIRNYVGVREKLKKLYEGGPEKLQVCDESRMIL